jgi:lysophospholipase L1-like esterase
VKRALLVIAGVLLGLGAGELLARAFGPEFAVVFRDSVEPSDDPVLVYTLRPDSPDGKLRISSAGLRDREFERPKPPGVFRIAAIGDSITYANGNARQNGWAKRLEAMIAARAPSQGLRVEVLNFGIPGYDVTQVAERLRTVGLSFQPDVVVYGYALNDPQGTSVEAQAIATLREAHEGDTRSGVGRWLAHSRLFLLARQVGARRSNREVLQAEPPRDPAYEAQKSGDRARYFRTLHTEGEGAARLAAGLDALAGIAREHALPVLVVIFPLFGDQGGEGPEALADVHRLVADAAAQRGFATLDLLPAYGAASRALGSDLSVDFMHPNRIGHRVAAVAILDWMCRTRWLPEQAIDCARDVVLEPEDAAIEETLRDVAPSDAGASAVAKPTPTP